MNESVYLKRKWGEVMTIEDVSLLFSVDNNMIGISAGQNHYEFKQRVFQEVTI